MALVGQCFVAALVLHIRGSAMWTIIALSLSWVLAMAFALQRGWLKPRDVLATKVPLSLFAHRAGLLRRHLARRPYRIDPRPR
jgi:hypothetical protein